MKKSDRDIIDDLFQSKLQGMEADVSPQDWEMIADRLPGARSVPLYRKAPFWAAAAVCLLMVMSGIYFFDDKQISDPIAQEVQRQTEEVKERMIGEGTPATIRPQDSYTSQETVATSVMAYVPTGKKQINKESLLVEQREVEEIEQPLRATDDDRMVSAAAEDDEPEQIEAAEETSEIAPRTTQTEKVVEKTKKQRKWGFGMGAGGVSVGSNNVMPNYLVTTMGLRSEDLMYMNASVMGKSIPKTNVHHNKPLSFGIGVSRYLNDRFSLQSGLTYTYLSSDWQTSDEYRVKTEQKLHFIGIPLGVSYRIAEWNRFNLYAYAGFQADLNVAGKQKGKLERDAIASNVVIDSELRSVREKKLLFSANAKVGVSYPIIRFLSAYAEVGAGYYFDNGSALFDKMSDMPTIYSEKPFNFTLQAGFRLGF